MGKYLYRVHRKALMFSKASSQVVRADGWQITKEYDEKFFLLYAYTEDGKNRVDVFVMPVAQLDSFEFVGTPDPDEKAPGTEPAYVEVVPDFSKLSAYTMNHPEDIVKALHDGKVIFAVDPGVLEAEFITFMTTGASESSDGRQEDTPQDPPVDGNVGATRSPS